MNIFEFAMEKEKLSESYYRQLAEKADHEGLKHICTMLADEESKHYRTVQQMSQKIPASLAQSQILGDAKKTFEKMRTSAETFNFDVSELELYQKARQIEQQSREFYLEKAEEADDPCQQGIFKKLAEEEQKHFVLLDNLCEFVARPQWFLENAEMYRFDDYVDGTL